MYLEWRRGQGKGFEDRSSPGEPGSVGLETGKRSEILPETEERDNGPSEFHFLNL